jgi:hypothetical protein
VPDETCPNLPALSNGRRMPQLSAIIRIGSGIYAMVHFAVAAGLLLHSIAQGFPERLWGMVAIQAFLGLAGVRAAGAGLERSGGDRVMGACVALAGVFDALYLLNQGVAPALGAPLVGPVSLYIEFDAPYRLAEEYTRGVAILPWVFLVTAIPVMIRLFAPSRREQVEKTGYL